MARPVKTREALTGFLVTSLQLRFLDAIEHRCPDVNKSLLEGTTGDLDKWASKYHVGGTWIFECAKLTLQNRELPSSRRISFEPMGGTPIPSMTVTDPSVAGCCICTFVDRKGTVWLLPARSSTSEPSHDPHDLHVDPRQLLYDFDGVKTRLTRAREKMLSEIEESLLTKLPFKISECITPFNAAAPSDLDAQMLYAAEYLCMRTPVHKIPQVKGHGFKIESTSHPYRRICALLSVLDIPIPRRR